LKPGGGFDFEGQTAVVTGGTRGLGRAITRAFLERGATVHATYRSDEDAARGFADSLGPLGERLRLARFDVASYPEVEAFWERLDTDAPDGVQVLVNNAGIRRDGILATMSPEDWSRVLDANLTGSFHMSRFAVRNMMQRRYGRIVMITSPAGRHGFEGQANYSASKAGQVALMRSLSKEVAKRKITVNCVSPGFVDTELLADLSEEQRKAHRDTIPMKRFGEPEEVAYAVLCLAAREAAYINGATLEVSGGL
jgi:3-oxoacyl-[acyl-carrier protein] reductase